MKKLQLIMPVYCLKAKPIIGEVVLVFPTGC